MGKVHSFKSKEENKYIVTVTHSKTYHIITNELISHTYHSKEFHLFSTLNSVIFISMLRAFQSSLPSILI